MCPLTRTSSGVVRNMSRVTQDNLVDIDDSWEMPTIVALMTAESASVTRLLHILGVFYMPAHASSALAQRVYFVFYWREKGRGAGGSRRVSFVHKTFL